MSSTLRIAGGTARLVNQAARHSAQQQQSLERLSTGKRINRPRDDPSGFAAAEQLRSEIARLTAELQNIGRRRALSRIEHSGLGAIHDRLIELRGYTVEAAGGLLSGAELADLSKQIGRSLLEIERIERQTQDVAADPFSNSHPTPVPPTKSRNRNTTTTPVSLNEAAQATDAKLDAVTQTQAAAAAAAKHQFDVPQTLIEDALVQHYQALSQIEDADFAVEASSFALAGALAEASLAALALQTSTYAEQLAELLDEIGAQLDETV